MKLIVLTGAQGVIGEEVSRLVRQQGYEVFAIDAKTNDKMDGSCENFHANALNWQVKFLELLSNHEQVDVHGLILAHGTHEIGPWKIVNQLKDSPVIESNFYSSIDYVGFFSQYLKSQSTILYLSSIVSMFPLPYSAVYSASKTATQTFLISHRQSLLRMGIILKILVVGNVNTGFNEKGHDLNSGENAKYELTRISKVIKSDKGISAHKVARKIVRMINHGLFPYEIYGRNAHLLHVALRILGFNFTLHLVDWILFRRELNVRRDH